MNLTKTLKKSGYDLIEGPIRNQKLLQLWLKKPGNRVSFYHEHIKHAFKSDVTLHISKNPALNVNSSVSNEYNFNFGITILENLLKSLGLGLFDIKGKIKNGKKISISFNNAYTEEIATGEIINYLTDNSTDFKNPNNNFLLKNLKRDNILVISSILIAENLVVEIETNSSIEINLEAKLTNMAKGKLDFKKENATKLKMTSKDGIPFPIAVKVLRLDYYNDASLKELDLVSDNRNFF